MVCTFVWEDNLQALASDYLPVQTHTPYNKFLIAPVVHCEMFDSILNSMIAPFDAFEILY